MTTEEEYELWNYMLAETCLLSDSSDGVVQLTITPQTLARAYEEAERRLLTPEEAEASFIAAVSPYTPPEYSPAHKDSAHYAL